MAENKKSFVLYCDIIHTVRKMPKDKAGELFMTILSYVNDENPQTDDMIIDLVFEPIKQQLKRDLKKWEGYIKKQRENGIKGGRPNKPTETQITQAFLNNPPQPKKADSVNVSVSVNERENTAPAHDLKNSNLFKQPNIPTKKQTLEAIVFAGGTKEMAKSFYDKHESTGWFINGSPVVNYTALAQRFVANWKANEDKSKKKYEPESNSAPLTKLNHGI
jgi:hypothetical protein